MEPRECPKCGKTFVPTDNRVIFCSRRCSKLKELPTKPCERCGREFTKNPEYSYAVWHAQRFCSHACRGSGRPVRTANCAACGSEFVLGSSLHYCSQACYWFSLRSERYPVNRRPRRLVEFSHALRRRILATSGQCARCGATEQLECDHVIPVWNGGTNAEDNGQVLCRPCHRAKTTADVAAYWAATAVA